MINTDEAQNLVRNRGCCKKIAERITNLVSCLIQKDFSHFVVYVNAPMDYRLAEMLYYMKISYKIDYTLGFCVETFDDLIKAIDDHGFEPADEIIASAKSIIWRKESWQERNFQVIKIL